MNNRLIEMGNCSIADPNGSMQQYMQYPQPQSMMGCYGYQLPCLCPPALNDFELTIFQTTADKEPLLNYGAKLRLVMADPYKGVDLRDAIAKLKTALKEVYKTYGI